MGRTINLFLVINKSVESIVFCQGHILWIDPNIRPKRNERVFLGYLLSKRLMYLDIILRPMIAPIKKNSRMLKLFMNTSELNLNIMLWKLFKLSIIIEYTPKIKSIYAPDIPGRIIAVMAINPDKNMYK